MAKQLTVTASRRYGTPSPLRYPGGKASLAGFFADLIGAIGIDCARYVEPYAHSREARRPRQCRPTPESKLLETR